jgi:hypothetical protein
VSKVADSIRRGLEEAIAYARGVSKESDYRVHVPAENKTQEDLEVPPDRPA